MKKLLISAIIVLLIILTGITVTKGLSIGKLTIFGLNDLKQNNEKLNTSLQQATKLASTDYPKKIEELNEELSKLEKEKEEYENAIDTNMEAQIKTGGALHSGYELDYLYIRIGTHAKTEGVEMNLVISRSSSGNQNEYDLNFTVTGGYARIAEFITDIEDDSSLGFEVEDFKMTSENSSETNNVQATFSCKNIEIVNLSSTIQNSNVDTQNNTTTNNVNTQNNTTTNNVNTQDNTVSNNTNTTK